MEGAREDKEAVPTKNMKHETPKKREKKLIDRLWTMLPGRET